ncbi:Protein kinase-like domain protein [Niveomyces insectorum RCEF 264]|uniref:Protein kinase-like domain protein n=1 Tax=Niveomyces insectorum RCEF 264 TaxID=1081102 RepID=A0A167TDV9_9HYPO|nr:Protein kinase-like domain protein [Niveomyces insectorum RCEF 264]
MRALTLLLYRANRTAWVRRLRQSPRGVLFVSSKLCIRRTSHSLLCEANTIQFVRERTSIPVPKVYCSFVFKGHAYILMGRLPGRCLGDGWLFRSAESRACLLEQLRRMVEELRRIKPPENFRIGNIDGGPFYDGRLPDKQFWGPYATIRDFHRDLRNNMESVPRGDDKGFPGLRKLIEFHNGSFPPPVFTHGDLSSFNILAEGDTITGIIDWETAAWMPSYWEYTTAWHVNPYNPFWQEEVGQFLTPLPHELEMEKIRRHYFKDF